MSSSTCLSVSFSPREVRTIGEGKKKEKRKKKERRYQSRGSPVMRKLTWPLTVTELTTGDHAIAIAVEHLESLDELVKEKRKKGY